VAIPIIQTVSISMRLRPRRSPKWPKITPQRAKQKADAEGGKRGERAHRGADLGKNSRLNTSAAVMP
jgi:hypothetical protein